MEIKGLSAVLKTKPFDAAEYLDSPEMIEVYLEEAALLNDPQAITMAMETAERATLNDRTLRNLRPRNP
jgi:DNA-binding phage protein